MTTLSTTTFLITIFGIAINEKAHTQLYGTTLVYRISLVLHDIC
jgi:hypothetical protein